MNNSNTALSRMLTVATVAVLVFALNVSGALAGFWRTLDGVSSNGVPNPAQFLYGLGWDGTTTGIFGYGYGFGYGTFDAGYGASTDNSSDTSVRRGWGGGGWGWSSLDRCPNGDTSGSSRDGKCSPDTTVTDPASPAIPTAPSTGGNTESCVFPNIGVNYNDTNGNWAIQYIDDLSSKGIMNGVNAGLMNPTGSFEPNRNTTRIEMLKIALRTFCYEYKDLQGIENFADVANGSWQARVVELANSMNIIDDSNTNFRPNDTVARAEAIKMILNVGSTRTATLAVDQSVTTTSFADVTVTWHAKYFDKAQSLNIMNGQNGNARPMDDITRSETTKVSKLSQDYWNGWTQTAAQ